MKYLNKFESIDNDLIQFGLKVDDIKWYFTDIIDEGFNFRTFSDKKLYLNKHDDDSFKFIKHKMLLINYINLTFTKKNISKESSDYLKSNEFKEVIEEAESRLIEKGLFTKEVIISITTEILRIQILIYRKIDEKYIK